MKIVHIGLFLLLTTSLGHAASCAPTPRKATASRASPTVRNTISGKVKTLPATSLPTGTILPPLRTTAPTTAVTLAGAAATRLTQEPPAQQQSITIETNRWQFYSYP